MSHPIPLLAIHTVIPADEANPQQVKRMIQVADQRLAGRTGGGPVCPECKNRGLEPMPESMLRQCRSCLAAVRIVVADGALKVESVPYQPRVFQYEVRRSAREPRT